MKTLFESFLRNVSLFPNKKAFTFLEDGENNENAITYQELALKSNLQGSYLSELSLYQQPVLLIFPPGLEYIEAFLACLASGTIAVPIYPPRGSKHTSRLSHIIRDSEAEYILTTEKISKRLHSLGRNILGKCQIVVFPTDLETSSSINICLDQKINDIAFIQYTSGSTANPKGVIVTNKNLMANEKQIQGAIHQAHSSVIVSWLPMYHDMGLVGNILHNLFVGSHCIFFSPVHFLQKPLRWLKAISKYKATLTGAPNFAFDLLNEIDVDNENVDLSSVEVFFSGAEKVRFDTLQIFEKKFKPLGLREQAIYPCYGLAEATLMVSGYTKNENYNYINVTQESINSKEIVKSQKDGIKLVSSGEVRFGLDIRILNTLGKVLPEKRIGEICISGSNVTNGYWRKDSGENFTIIDRQQYLRTGDLGFLLGGHLYITGRKKELVIRNGVNYYPYDIERVVANSHRALPLNGCAVFSVEKEDRERLIIVSEIKRIYYRSVNADEVFQAVNSTMSETYGFLADDIVLIKPMSIPKTSSGKIKRKYCAQQYEENRLEAIASAISKKSHSCVCKRNELGSEVSTGDDSYRIFQNLKEIIFSIIQEEILLSPNDNIHSLGLDSLKFMQFIAAVESDYQIRIPINQVYKEISLTQFVSLIKKSGNRKYSHDLQDYVSSNQQGLYLGSRSQLTRNNIGFSFCIKGLYSPRDKINYALKKALSSLGYTGESFKFSDGKLIRGPKQENLYEEVYFNSKSDTDWLINQEFSKEIDVLNANNPLIRLLIIEIEEENQRNTYVAIIAHHIIADGWSLKLLFDRWLSFFKGENKAEQFQVETLDTFFHDEQCVLANKTLCSLAKSVFEKHVLHDNVNALLHNVKPRKSVEKIIPICFPLDLIKEKSMAIKVTPFLLLLGSYHFALNLLTSSDVIASAFPISRRSSSSRQNAFGYLVNLIYLSSEPTAETKLLDYFSELKENYRESLEYQEVPHTHLIRESKLDNNLLEALGFYYFAYQAVHNKNQFIQLFQDKVTTIEKNDEWQVQSNPTKHYRGNFQVELELFELENSIEGAIKYDSSFFNETFVDTLAHTISDFVYYINTDTRNQTLASFKPTFKALSISRGEKVELNAECFLEQFEASVQHYPNNTAIISHDIKYSYSELDNLTNIAAAALIHKFKIKKDDIIILMNGRHAYDIIAILAIMKAGGVYAPVDKEIPEDRLKAIVKQTQTKLLIGYTYNSLSFIESVLVPELLSFEIPLDFIKQNNSSDTAYIIHTSGTTGVPKGVRIKQKGLVNLNTALVKAYDLNESDRIVQFAALSFDMSVEEIFPILSVGGSIVIRTEECISSANTFKQFCEKYSITILNLPTSFWNEIITLDHFPPSIRLISVGGEKMKRELVKKWFKKFRHKPVLFNAYGPTEYTVNATLKNLRYCDVDTVSVGSPIINTSVSIRNFKGYILPPHIVGEVVIEGQGMADGYTSVQDNSPFKTENGKVYYFTGDLGYCDEHGELIIVGRKDKQTKIRGFRIELGEIENELIGQNNISQATVLVHEEQICAFVTLKIPQQLSESKIKQDLRKGLPEYMIPDQIILVDKIPVNIRRKIDEKQLRALVKTDFEDENVPTSELEIRLAAMWKSVLGINQIGVFSNFFEMGGHSLKAINLLSRVEKEFQITVNMKTFYSTPTIREFSELLETLIWVDGTSKKTQDQNEIVI